MYRKHAALAAHATAERTVRTVHHPANMQSYAAFVALFLVVSAGTCRTQGEESDSGSSPEESSPSPATNVACKFWLCEYGPPDYPSWLYMTVHDVWRSYERELQLAALPMEPGRFWLACLRPANSLHSQRRAAVHELNQYVCTRGGAATLRHKNLAVHER